MKTLRNYSNEDMNQLKPIELSPDNWPVNKNYTQKSKEFFSNKHFKIYLYLQQKFGAIRGKTFRVCMAKKYSQEVCFKGWRCD